jgi:hypothetical protein
MGLPIIGDVIKVVGGVIDKIIPDKSEAAKMKHEIAMSLVNADLGQMAINKEEAAHPSVFVSGWRPAVGWVCVLALAFNYIIAPLWAWAAVIWMPDAIIPQLDISELLTLLFGLLGMGTLRSYDKSQGTARHKI